MDPQDDDQWDADDTFIDDEWDELWEEEEEMDRQDQAEKAKQARAQENA